MICITIQDKTYPQIIEILQDPLVEMTEIRLDRCTLTDEEIEDIFANSDIPLVATCRASETGDPEQAWRLLRLAIEAGARFADLETDAPVSVSKRCRKLCRETGTGLIRSYHNFEETPSDEVLQMALARCFRYGADIAKVVTMCNSAQDRARLEALYSVVLEGVDSMEGRLIAFGMGEAGKPTRLECLRRSAPFTYASYDVEAAPGQIPYTRMMSSLYGARPAFRKKGLRMPASKSFAQRAIIAAALAEGTSHLYGYSPCEDSEAALKVALALGADIDRDGSTLAISGIGGRPGRLALETLDTGESGLLTRLMIPIMAAMNDAPIVITGRGTLLRRPLLEAADIMAAFGVILSNEEEHPGRELFVPVKVKGRMIPGMADVSGKGGSQLVSGLLMALPLCDKPSTLYVNEPKSIPYMYITLDVLRHFGIQTRSEMEGDAEMLEQQDWSYCTGITFKTRQSQRYRAADFDIEGDWSAAANFLVAGAVFGGVEIEGLDTASLQADLSIIDILVDAGASVSQLEADDAGAGGVCVGKGPLEAIVTNLDHAPDLFPIVAVLAAFCAGESRIGGVGRLVSKESNRAEAIVKMLEQMGVGVSICEDEMVICGETLASRILNGRLLKGGKYSSNHDHRMVMALKVASLGASSPIEIDDEACVAKSFPEFREMFS